IVPADGVGGTAGLNLERPAIAAEQVAGDRHPGRSFHIYGRGITEKAARVEMAVADLFQEDAVGAAAKIVRKSVSGHVDAMREHHRNAGFVVAETVPLVPVVMRKHEMQAIPDIVIAVITADQRMGDEFKVDAVPVPRDVIVQYPHVVAMPAMDPIAQFDRLVCPRAQTVPLERTTVCLLTIQAKISVLQYIVP